MAEGKAKGGWVYGWRDRGDENEGARYAECTRVGVFFSSTNRDNYGAFLSEIMVKDVRGSASLIPLET